VLVRILGLDSVLELFHRPRQQPQELPKVVVVIQMLSRLLRTEQQALGQEAMELRDRVEQPVSNLEDQEAVVVVGSVEVVVAWMRITSMVVVVVALPTQEGSTQSQVKMVMEAHQEAVTPSELRVQILPQEQEQLQQDRMVSL
jgi:hypothetical protein